MDWVCPAPYREERGPQETRERKGSCRAVSYDLPSKMNFGPVVREGLSGGLIFGAMGGTVKDCDGLSYLLYLLFAQHRRGVGGGGTESWAKACERGHDDHQQDESSRQDEQPVPALPLAVGQDRLFDGIILGGACHFRPPPPNRSPLRAPAIAANRDRDTRSCFAAP